MSALRVPLAFAPSTGVRVTNWRVDPHLAHLALTADRRRPLSPVELNRCLSDIERLGYRGVVTAALGPPDQRVFIDAGFEVIEQLHLLRHRLEPLPAYRTNATRRARRRDHPAVLEVDAAAFLPFWQLDEPTLNEALTATRTSRLRVAENAEGTIVGYAICGRSSTRGYVQRLAVHPDHHGEGLGAALLVDGLHWLARWGAHDALVNTQQGNERSLRLYLRTGFEPEPCGLAVLRCDFGGQPPDELSHPRAASAPLAMTRGRRARPDRRSTRPRSRPARQGLLAAAIVGLSLLGTGGAGAAVPSPAPAGWVGAAGPASQETGGAHIELVEQTPWVRPGEQLRLRFRVEQVPAAASVQLIFHDPLVTRGDFADTLDGELGGTAAPPTPAQPLTALARATDGTYEMEVTIGGDGDVNLSSHGVYPLELVVADAPGTLVTSLVSYLLLLPASDEEFPPLGVAVVMEIGGPPGLKPDGTVQPDDATTGHVNDRIEALTQAEGVPLTVAPVPETLDALAGRGTPGLETLERLRSAVGRRDVLGRPYVDLDLDALAAAGLLPQVPPQALAGAQVLRERLHEPLERTWLTGPTVGDAEVDALRDLGVGRVLVPESAVEGLAQQSEGPVPVGPVALTDDGPLAGVTDDTLASRLLGGEGELDTQRFLAELTMIWLAKPSIGDRAVVVRIPEDAPVEPVVLGRALRALTDGGAVQAITLDDYFKLPPVGGDDPVVVERTADGAPVDLRSITRPLENGQRAISGLAGTLDDRETIQSLYRSLLISLDAELTMAQRRAYINRVGVEVARISDGVNAPSDFKITLTARSGTIPLTIENRTDQTVSVDVLLQSSQLEFPDGDHKKVVVPAGGRRIDLKVRTRTSGAFPLHITLTSPDRNVVFDRTTFTIRSTAVSGVGLVLSVGAGAFLLIWWARHWRTARRSRGLGH